MQTVGRVLPGITLVLCLTLLGVPSTADAQDLFELEVFTYETTARGHYEVAFHSNVMSKGGVSADQALEAHRPVHLSVEVVRGWTDRLETGVFLQTAPFGPARSARFAGGHVRSKLRITSTPRLPFRVAAGAEYSFNRPAFDRERQTLELRSILDRTEGRFSVVLNPSLELVTHGSDDGLEPSFDLSARTAWDLMPHVSIAAEYFSRSRTTRHLEPERDAHHLLFSGVDLELPAGWELGLAAGHCVTSSEPWVVKTILGYRFGR